MRGILLSTKFFYLQMGEKLGNSRVNSAQKPATCTSKHPVLIHSILSIHTQRLYNNKIMFLLAYIYIYIYIYIHSFDFMGSFAY